MTPERFNKIQTVLNHRQPDLTVITDEVHKHRNIAAIVRTCDAVGIDTVHSVMPEMGYQIYGGTAASANKWVTIQHYSKVEEPVEQLKQKGYQVVAAQLSDSAVDYRQVDYTIPTALIMGAEIKGVSQNACDLADSQIILPMMGMVESYNVSVACALILSEAQRQREAKGLYRERRLDDDTYIDRFFNWAHPKLALFCDENNLDYPEVDDEGEVINLPDWYKSAREKIKT